MKKTTKRIFCLLMTLAVSLSLVTPAFALDSFEAGTDVIETEPYNEYDYICALRNASVAQLHAEGMTVQESVSAINEFETAFAYRATLPDDELRDLGYSSESIQLLRRYAGGEKLSADEMRAATATCSGSIQRQFFSGRKVAFVYRWSWSMCPTVQKTDSAAMRWVISDPKGIRIEDIKCSFKTAYVTYYRGDEATYTNYASYQPIDSFDAVNAQFPMSYGGYAKIGCIKMTIVLPDDVDNTINSIKVAAKYGHTIKNNEAPTISIGFPWSLTINFTQSEFVVQRLADCKVRISSGGIEKI